MRLQTKRIYDSPAPSDGRRVLVDGIWPRGMSRDRALMQGWAKVVAPSPALRKWFGHDPKRWEGFRQRYFRELDEHAPEVRKLLAEADGGTVTLLYAATDHSHNNAVALKQYLESRSRGGNA